MKRRSSILTVVASFLIGCALGVPVAQAGGADAILVLNTVRAWFGGSPIAVTGTPSDGHVLTYDSTTGTWRAEAAAAGGSQTPWTSAIDGASYALTGVGAFSASSATISGTTSATVTAPIQRWSSGAGKTLTSAECRGHVYVVTGEATIPFTLPAAPTAGDHVTFLLAASTPLKITAGTGDSITLTSTTLSTNTDGYIYTTRNSSSVHLVWDSGTSNWYGTDVVGTWAFDSTTSAGYAYTPTPWTTFTATGSWTNVTYTACKYQQVGSLLRINYRLTVTGTPADAGQVYLDMPSGFTVDEAGIGSPYNGYVGGGSMTNTGSGAVYTVLWHYLTSVPNKVYGYDTAVPHASVTKSSPATVGSGFELDTYVTVPVD